MENPFIKGFGRPQIGAVQTIRQSIGNESGLRGSLHEHGLYGNHYNERHISRPYVVLVQNENHTQTNYILFGSASNRLAANYGNPIGINISCGMEGYSYSELLADTEVRPFTLGRIRIDTLDSNTRNLEMPVSVTKISAQGTVFMSPLTPYTALNQFITSAIEIPCNFEIDNGTAINGSLVPKSKVRISFYPASRVSFDNLEDIARRKREADAAEYESIRYLLLLTID